jgi:hypothetical protein
MQCYWIAVFVLLFIAGSVVADGLPNIKVPLTSVPVKIDGQFHANEWQDAALLQRMYILGTTEQSTQNTKVYLKYDSTALYVGIHCSEKVKGYPKAYKRKPTDYLGDDDAVQVVLGVADQSTTRDTLMMGGYEGAMNTEVAKADHYYQFSVNAAGASTRTYNESPLERPLFESAVSKSVDGWYVEMRIPFESAGFKSSKGRTVFFNFYRFRPPVTLGWYAQAYGGYSPMSFGTLTLSDSDQKTIEQPLPPVALKKKSPTTTPKAIAIMDFYPLAGEVIARINGGTNKKPSTAILQIDGVGEKKVTVKGNDVKLAVSIPKSYTSAITAHLTVRSADGKLLFDESKEFKNPTDKPAWSGNDVSADYEKLKVPAPWKKPVITGHRVKLHNKTMDFGNSGLLNSVAFADGDLLAGNSEVILKAKGKILQLGAGKTVAKLLGNQALVQSINPIPGGAVEIRNMVDYDGFTVVKLRVTGLDSSTINKLAVRIPIKPEDAKFVYRETAQTIRELTGFGWEGKAGPVWVGGHDKGLSFDFDTPVFLSKNERSQIQVVEEKGKTWLQVNLVDAKGQIKERDHIFRFILQPTPTRQPSLDKTGIYHRTALWFEEWTDYQGYPDLTKMSKVKERSDKAHTEGKLQMIYFGQVLASNAPGFNEFQNDFLAPPSRGWYKRAYDPGKDVVCYVSCARGAFGDLLLDGIKKLSDQGGIDGVYMDGTSVPWDCDNPSHIYCAGRPEIGWDAEDFTPYIGTRRFLKRLRGIFDSKNKPYYMMAHTGGAINIATMSLCDGHYEGEQLARYRPGYRLPLSTFASGYCGRPWGFRTDLLPIRPVYSCEEMRTWGLLHDGEVGDGPYGEPGGAALENRIYGDFQDDTKVKYYPYWQSQPHVKINKGNVLCSYYRKDDSAMVILGNLSWTDQDVVVDLSKLFPGKVLQAIDVVNQVPFAVKDNKLVLTLKLHRYAAFLISPQTGNVVVADKPIPDTSTTPVPFNVSKLASEDWQLAKDRYGVGIDREYKMGDTPGCIKLTSTLWMAEANIRLEKYPIGSGAHVKLRIQHSGILKISIGNSGFYYGGNWVSYGLDPWNRGVLYQPTAVKDRPVEIELSLKNGLLDATYDGKALASGLALGGLDNQSILALATWSNDWLAFDLGQVSSEPVVLYAESVKHPVL